MNLNKSTKIAVINDDRTVILNVGSDDGVKKGQFYKIVDNTPAVIKDPDTGKVLASLKRFKQKIKVIEVYPTYSICTSVYKKKAGDNHSLASMIIESSNGMERLYKNNKYERTVGRPMNVESKEITPVLSKYSYSKVHVGDKVILTKE